MKLPARLALLFGISGITMFAAPLCTDFRSLTAADMASFGSVGCQFDDKIFYNFSYSYTVQNASGAFPGDANTPAVPASAVSIEFTSLGGDPLKPVLSLVGTWQAAGGTSGNVSVTYQVSAPLSAQMYFSWLQVNGQVSNVDAANQINSYISGADHLIAGINGVDLLANLIPPVTTTPLAAYTTWDGKSYAPTTTLRVIKDIYIDGGTGTNLAILNRVDQGLYELSDVPEPWSGSLMGGGLMLVGAFRARKRSKAA